MQEDVDCSSGNATRKNVIEREKNVIAWKLPFYENYLYINRTSPSHLNIIIIIISINAKKRNVHNICAFAISARNLYHKTHYDILLLFGICSFHRMLFPSPPTQHLQKEISRLYSALSEYRNYHFLISFPVSHWLLQCTRFVWFSLIQPSPKMQRVNGKRNINERSLNLYIQFMKVVVTIHTRFKTTSLSHMLPIQHIIYTIQNKIIRHENDDDW